MVGRSKERGRGEEQEEEHGETGRSNKRKTEGNSQDVGRPGGSLRCVAVLAVRSGQATRRWDGWSLGNPGGSWCGWLVEVVCTACTAKSTQASSRDRG